MLRAIYQGGRRRVRKIDTESSTTDSDDLAPSSTTTEGDLEPWEVWIRRVTHEVEERMQRLKIEDWVAAQRRRKYRWTGHVARREDGRWSTKLMSWQPVGGRRQGQLGQGRKQARPKRRWCDDLDAYFSSLDPGGWQILAADREEWKAHEESFMNAS